ncbi:MAG TPA: pyridoxal-phosphate dependent enzyme [Anaerolineales bacterium]|nr:pyridoxal-phosphate dependent enzyme [Anaerolineales bacterium]
MSRAAGYRCSVCDRTFGISEVTYTCPHDGGNLDVLLDIEAIRREHSPETIGRSRETSLWRYLPLLPVEDPEHEGTALRAAGWTPLLEARRLAGDLGLRNVWLKDDGRNPTASFKDRASAVVVARAQEIGAETVVTASTGNAGAALAGMAAAAGQPAVILAPKTAPQAKVAQLLVFGAKVFLVDGTYDQAFDLTLEASKAFGWYCRNTGYNPFTAEGKKTAAFEICEQMTLEVGVGAKHAVSHPVRAASPRKRSERRGPPGRDGRRAAGLRGTNGGVPLHWTSPDAVFVSVGDGNIISGLHKGFRDLLDLGWIERMPRLYGIQSTGSAAIAGAFERGTETIEPVHADTLADSISVDLPRDGLRGLRAATRTNGAYLTVTDAEILAAISTLGRREAVFAEPAGAAGYAGLMKAVVQSRVGPDERIVVMVTGSGLKDVRAAMQAVGEAVIIPPSLDALQRALA